MGAQWTFLSGPDRTVPEETSTSRSHTDPEHNPMIPHTLVPKKPGLIIRSVYSGWIVLGAKPSVVDLWHDLRAVTRRFAPTDLRAPRLREAWNAGDVSAFHGYNKDPKKKH